MKRDTIVGDEPNKPNAIIFSCFCFNGASARASVYKKVRMQYCSFFKQQKQKQSQQHVSYVKLRQRTQVLYTRECVWGMLSVFPCSALKKHFFR